MSGRIVLAFALSLESTSLMTARNPSVHHRAARDGGLWGPALLLSRMLGDTAFTGGTPSQQAPLHGRASAGPHAVAAKQAFHH